jgi:hypothetical protein
MGTTGDGGPDFLPGMRIAMTGGGVADLLGALVPSP